MMEGRRTCKIKIEGRKEEEREKLKNKRMTKEGKKIKR